MNPTRIDRLIMLADCAFGIGIVLKRQVKTSKDFFQAGRSIPTRNLRAPLGLGLTALMGAFWHQKRFGFLLLGDALPGANPCGLEKSVFNT